MSPAASAERSGQRRHGVVRAKEARRVAVPADAREHRLFERGERPRLDHLRRNGAREGSEDEKPGLVGQRERGPGKPHDEEERRVPPAAAHAVAGACDRDRGERYAGEKRCENNADLESREAAASEGDPDQDAAEPIGKRAERLDGQDATGVCGQAVSLWHHA